MESFLNVQDAVIMNYILYTKVLEFNCLSGIVSNQGLIEKNE